MQSQALHQSIEVPLRLRLLRQRLSSSSTDLAESLDTLCETFGLTRCRLLDNDPSFLGGWNHGPLRFEDGSGELNLLREGTGDALVVVDEDRRDPDLSSLGGHSKLVVKERFCNLLVKFVLRQGRIRERERRTAAVGVDDVDLVALADEVELLSLGRERTIAPERRDPRSRTGLYLETLATGQRLLRRSPCVLKRLLTCASNGQCSSRREERRTWQSSCTGHGS